MSWGRGVYIGDTSQSVSGWWQPVCRFAWLRTHVRWHLVLHMSFSMAKKHAGRHHSSQMSGFMTGTHATRHTISHMSISMLRLHAQRHLVLGRSTSCFYMSGCMYSFHARWHLVLLETLSLLDGWHHVLNPCNEPPRASRFIRLISVFPAIFLSAINSEYFSAPIQMSLIFLINSNLNSDLGRKYFPILRLHRKLP